MIIYLIRHSKPDVPEGIFYGHSDVELCKAEFDRTVSWINHRVDRSSLKHIYTSPLKRCYSLAQTLKPDNAGFHTDKRIMELNFGKWELQQWDNIDPKALGKWINDFVHTQTPGGESFMNLYHRTSEFWDELIKHKEGPLAVVTHGGVIKSILSRILYIPAKKSQSIKVRYGELISIQYFGEDQYEIEFLIAPQ
jgi:alpha-ribazole phosphatase